MKDLSVIVPCYNESGNIEAIVNRFSEIMADSPVDAQVVLVDNGSVDDSFEVMRKFTESVPNHRFLIHRVETNEGYGHGILEGLKVADGQVLSWTHADLQTDPLDVWKAYEIFKKENSPNLVVKGRRVKRKVSEAVFSWGMQMIASFALKTRLSEVNAQPKLFHRDFYSRHLLNGPKDFSLDLFLLYCARNKGAKIIEFNVEFKKRIAGEAKGGGSLKTRIKLIKRTFAYIFQLRQSVG